MLVYETIFGVSTILKDNLFYTISIEKVKATKKKNKITFILLIKFSLLFLKVKKKETIYETKKKKDRQIKPL